MNFNDYQDLAAKFKKNWDNPDCELAYLGLGVSGEAGEVTDVIKKHFVGSKQINPDDLAKELGDVLWYVSQIAQFYGFKLSDIAQINIDKLRARHGGEQWSGYGDRTGQGA